MVVDPELPRDHRGDAVTGPDGAAESVRFGTVREELRDQRLLRFGQTGGGALVGACAERIGTAATSHLQPLADGRPAHTERLGDPDGPPTLLTQLEGPQAAPFEPVREFERSSAHARRSYCGRC